MASKGYRVHNGTHLHTAVVLIKSFSIVSIDFIWQELANPTVEAPGKGYMGE